MHTIGKIQKGSSSEPYSPAGAACLLPFIFLSVLSLLTLAGVRLLPEGGLSIITREVLIILGWVALWRPADLLLYDWRTIKRKINFIQKLEQSTVEIILETKPRVKVK